MSQSCSITKCNRISRGLCDCCQQNLCLQHLNEHNDTLITQLYPLADEINMLGDHLTTLSIRSIVDDYRQLLERWRVECHEKIDHFVEQKCEELIGLVDNKIKKKKEEIERIRFKVTELLHRQETTRQDIDSLTASIHQLKINMNKIEQMRLEINVGPLIVDDTLVFIKEAHELDLSTIPPVYKTIDRPPQSYTALTSNNRFLLIHQHPNLCLIDQEVNIIKHILWPYAGIYDMCWSSTLNRFILIGEFNIFLIEENKMTIENIETVKKRSWGSCTCSETFLFLSTNEYASSVMKFTLLPSIEFVEEWKFPDTCARDEIIDDILYNNERLVLTVKNTSKKLLRIELRYAMMFDRIWSLGFDTVCDRNSPFRCCLLSSYEWLVVDYETIRLLHITKDGQLMQTLPYEAIPYNANVFGNMFVVLRSGGINFHKLRL